MKTALTTAALALMTTTAHAQPAEAAVDSLMATYAQPGMPGAAVLVVKDGRVVLEQSYGLAEVETRTPVTGETDFRLASLSKEQPIDGGRWTGA